MPPPATQSSRPTGPAKHRRFLFAIASSLAVLIGLAAVHFEFAFLGVFGNGASDVAAKPRASERTQERFENVARAEGNVTQAPVEQQQQQQQKQLTVPKPRVIETPHTEFLAPDQMFLGARQWHDLWTFGSPSQRGANNNHNNDNNNIDPHIHDDEALRHAASTINSTWNYVSNIQTRYANVDALPDFYARGNGWIYDRLGMVLTSFAIVGAKDSAGVSSVFIVDTLGKISCGVHGNDNDDENWMERYPPLTMWVRVNGPEIFAGTAMPHRWKPTSAMSSSATTTRCAWKYDFVPQMVGEYTFHVKLLTFHGLADFDPAKCQEEKITRNAVFDVQDQSELEVVEEMNYRVVQELAEEGNFSHHRGISGFKFYAANGACCEACTRARGCKMWSIPGARHFDECELYFPTIADDTDFLDRHNGHYLGRGRTYSYRSQDPKEFEIPTHVRGMMRRRRKLATAYNTIGKIWPIKDRPAKGVSRNEPTAFFLGCGWSSMMSFETPCHYPTDDLVFGSGSKVTVEYVSGNTLDKVPRQCTLEDEKLDVSNGHWVRYPYPNVTECGELIQDDVTGAWRDFRAKYDGDRPQCWWREDVTKITTICGEAGCGDLFSHRWVSDIRKESAWFGKWELKGCMFRDMGDNEIQQCIDAKNITAITTDGASIKAVLDGYLAQKLQNINMTNATSVGDEGRTISLSTLKMPHLLWAYPLDEHRKKLETEFPDVTDNKNEYYFMTGFYYSSEREPHVQVDRSLQFSQMAYDILSKKGYKMLNAFDVTAAFAYDTDGQGDGLHITGPPIKTVIMKFFHHLCQTVAA
eukprot:CCRYP_019842-RA/>CCRYP_019842-RA protein AED:0.04 eAED:0.04 QI:241/1/1/1/0.75/0.6/5/196/808